MKNEFDQRIKDNEQEILDLKTASEYTSVKLANFTSSTLVRTGVYQITYGAPNEEIISSVFCGTSGSNWGISYPRTPSGNTQIVEVNSDRYDDVTEGYVTYDVPLSIASNRPVTSVVRL